MALERDDRHARSYRWSHVLLNREGERADAVIVQAFWRSVAHASPGVLEFESLELADDRPVGIPHATLLNRDCESFHKLLLRRRAELEPFEVRPALALQLLEHWITD